MSHFATHTLLEAARQANSFIPNLLGTMAQAPALLEG